MKFLAIFFLGFLALPLTAETPIPPGASYDLGFSPGGTSLEVVLKAVGSAKASILVAAYEFTSHEIADALVTAEGKGVKVQVVADFKASKDRASILDQLRNAGIPVRLDKRYAIHHHKFMVIDAEHVETGSFNYTEAAVKHNAENALVLWHMPSLAASYTEEWNRLWGESR
jgi:phosphatidylserine/phosphatidylglycerophosphate/cardiolipin synthase-like enzyme